MIRSFSPSSTCPTHSRISIHRTSFPPIPHDYLQDLQHANSSLNDRYHFKNLSTEYTLNSALPIYPPYLHPDDTNPCSSKVVDCYNKLKKLDRSTPCLTRKLDFYFIYLHTKPKYKTYLLDVLDKKQASITIQDLTTFFLKSRRLHDAYELLPFADLDTLALKLDQALRLPENAPYPNHLFDKQFSLFELPKPKSKSTSEFNSIAETLYRQLQQDIPKLKDTWLNHYYNAFPETQNSKLLEECKKLIPTSFVVQLDSSMSSLNNFIRTISRLRMYLHPMLHQSFPEERVIKRFNSLIDDTKDKKHATLNSYLQFITLTYLSSNQTKEQIKLYDTFFEQLHKILIGKAITQKDFFSSELFKLIIPEDVQHAVQTWLYSCYHDLKLQREKTPLEDQLITIKSSFTLLLETLEFFYINTTINQPDDSFTSLFINTMINNNSNKDSIKRILTPIIKSSDNPQSLSFQDIKNTLSTLYNCHHLPSTMVRSTICKSSATLLEFQHAHDQLNTLFENRQGSFSFILEAYLTPIFSSDNYDLILDNLSKLVKPIEIQDKDSILEFHRKKDTALSFSENNIREIISSLQSEIKMDETTASLQAENNIREIIPSLQSEIKMDETTASLQAAIKMYETIASLQYNSLHHFPLDEFIKFHTLKESLPITFPDRPSILDKTNFIDIFTQKKIDKWEAEIKIDSCINLLEFSNSLNETQKEKMKQWDTDKKILKQEGVQYYLNHYDTLANLNRDELLTQLLYYPRIYHINSILPLSEYVKFKKDLKLIIDCIKKDQLYDNLDIFKKPYITLIDCPHTLYDNVTKKEKLDLIFLNVYELLEKKITKSQNEFNALLETLSKKTNLPDLLKKQCKQFLTHISLSALSFKSSDLSQTNLLNLQFQVLMLISGKIRPILTSGFSKEIDYDHPVTSDPPPALKAFNAIWSDLVPQALYCQNPNQFLKKYNDFIDKLCKHIFTEITKHNQFSLLLNKMIFPISLITTPFISLLSYIEYEFCNQSSSEFTKDQYLESFNRSFQLLQKNLDCLAVNSFIGSPKGQKHAKELRQLFSNSFPHRKLELKTTDDLKNTLSDLSKDPKIQPQTFQDITAILASTFGVAYGSYGSFSVCINYFVNFLSSSSSIDCLKTRIQTLTKDSNKDNKAIHDFFTQKQNALTLVNEPQIKLAIQSIYHYVLPEKISKASPDFETPLTLLKKYIEFYTYKKELITEDSSDSLLPQLQSYHYPEKTNHDLFFAKKKLDSERSCETLLAENASELDSKQSNDNPHRYHTHSTKENKKKNTAKNTKKNTKKNQNKRKRQLLEKQKETFNDMFSKTYKCQINTCDPELIKLTFDNNLFGLTKKEDIEKLLNNKNQIDIKTVLEETNKIKSLCLDIQKHSYKNIYNELDQFISSFSSSQFNPTEIANKLLTSFTFSSSVKQLSDLSTLPDSILSTLFESIENKIDESISNLKQDTEKLERLLIDTEKIFNLHQQHHKSYKIIEDERKSLTDKGFDFDSIINYLFKLEDSEKTFSDFKIPSLNIKILTQNILLLQKCFSKLKPILVLTDSYKNIYDSLYEFIHSRDYLDESIEIKTKDTILTTLLKESDYYQLFPITTLAELEVPKDIINLRDHCDELEKLFKTVKTQYFSQASTSIKQSCKKFLELYESIKHDQTKLNHIVCQKKHQKNDIFLDPTSLISKTLTAIENNIMQLKTFLHDLETPIEQTNSLTTIHVDYRSIRMKFESFESALKKQLTPIPIPIPTPIPTPTPIPIPTPIPVSESTVESTATTTAERNRQQKQNNRKRKTTAKTKQQQKRSNSKSEAKANRQQKRSNRKSEATAKAKRSDSES